MSEKWQGPTQGVGLIEVSINKRELTVALDPWLKCY